MLLERNHLRPLDARQDSGYQSNTARVINITAIHSLRPKHFKDQYVDKPFGYFIPELEAAVVF